MENSQVITPKIFNALRELGQVNKSIMLQPNTNDLWVLESSSAILAHTKIDLIAPGQYGIYDIHRFLGVASIISKTPKLVFGPNEFVLMGDNNQTVHYIAAASIVMPKQVTKEVITAHKTAAIAKFDIHQRHLTELRKAAAVLGVEHVTVYGSANQPDAAFIKASNVNGSSDSITIRLHATSIVEDFEASIRVDRLVIASGDYSVIVAPGVVYFSSENTDDLPGFEYWIAEGIK